MTLQGLCTSQILVNLRPDEKLRLVVLLVCKTKGSAFYAALHAQKRTFEGEHKIIKCILVLFVRFRVILLDIFFDRALHDLNSSLD